MQYILIYTCIRLMVSSVSACNVESIKETTISGTDDAHSRVACRLVGCVWSQKAIGEER